MKPTPSVNPIPSEIAWQLCEEIRIESTRKWYTLAGMQCRGCIAFSRGDRAKMCVSNRPDNRGCNLVSARFDRSESRFG